MSSKATVQGFWEGKGSAMSAARESARKARTHGNYTAAASILASAHYSRAGTLRTRGKLWLPLVAYHFFRARSYALKMLRMSARKFIDDFEILSPDQLDIAATVLRKGPFPKLDLAMACLDVGYEQAMSSGGPQHTLALLEIGFGECFEKSRIMFRHVHASSRFNNAAERIPRIEQEENNLHGKRQLVRILKACGAYFTRVGDPRGEEFLRRAKELAREVSPDQLAKIEAVM